MDWLTFVASLSGSLAWPIALVIVVLAFRRQIAGAAGLVSRLRYGDVEVTFRNELKDLEIKADEAGLPSRFEAREIVTGRPADAGAPAVAEQDQLEAMAQSLPPAAVAWAWTTVEHELAGAVRRLGLMNDTRWLSPRHAGHLLVAARKISPETARIIERMSALRNQVVHDRKAAEALEPPDATDYLDSVYRLLAQLKKVA